MLIDLFEAAQPKKKSARTGIQRFEGASKMNDVTLLKFLKAIMPSVQNGQIDLDSMDNVKVTEKFDSSFSAFGLNDSAEFFLQSSNSGEVTSANLEQKFGTMPDFYESFKSLQDNKVFQRTLKKIYKKFGSFKYDSEIFPTLTHTGDTDGNVIFVGTKYNKKRLGEDGAFMVFKASIKESGEWTVPTGKVQSALTTAI